MVEFSYRVICDTHRILREKDNCSIQKVPARYERRLWILKICPAPGLTCVDRLRRMVNYSLPQGEHRVNAVNGSALEGLEEKD